MSLPKQHSGVLNNDANQHSSLFFIEYFFVGSVVGEMVVDPL